MERIFLLNPPALVFAGKTLPLRRVANTMPSIAICSLGAVLRHAGYQVRILDGAALGWSLDECLQSILDYGPDMVGITTYTSTIHTAEELGRRIKMHSPQTVLIMGGPHVSAIARIEPGLLPNMVDYVVIGEGEETVIELVDSLRRDLSPATIPGLMVRHDGSWSSTGERAYIEDIDTLPDPAYDLLPSFPRAYQPPVFSYRGQASVSICSSRGCPFNCSFCDHTIFGRQFRSLSVPRILDLVERVQGHFNVDHILFVDDNVSVRHDDFHELCGQLSKRKKRINWSADVRADSLEHFDFKLIKDSGCIRMNVGLESGDDEMLERMNKKLDPGRAQAAINTATRAGIYVKGLFLIGFPGESPRSIRNTQRFLHHTRLSEINVSKFAPYPGTQYYELFREHEDHRQFWRKLDGLHFCDHDDSRRKWLEQAFRNVLFTFYSRPSIGFSYCRRMVTFPESRQRLFAFLGEYGRMLRGLPPIPLISTWETSDVQLDTQTEL